MSLFDPGEELLWSAFVADEHTIDGNGRGCKGPSRYDELHKKLPLLEIFGEDSAHWQQQYEGPVE